MPSTPVIAILDVGKTNKKLFLFDESYNTLWEKTDLLPETKDEDGDPCENLDGLKAWIREGLHAAGRTRGFDLRAINFSAYGASLVHIAEDGESLTPLYNYLKPYPDKLKKQFYEQYGGELTFSMLSASPVLGSLNSGMQLYRIKNERPDLFAKIKYSLHLPQWLSWLMTGKPCSDITSIGCHTNLWNFSQDYYQEWVFREGVIDKLPPIQSSGTVYPFMPRVNGEILSDLPEIGLSGIGLHDSSAAMIPYLESFMDPFILISTGTWCISMNPFNTDPLTSAELQNDCLCYLSFKGRAVKASRLFAGYEHEQQVERLAEHFLKNKNHYQKIAFDPAMVTQLQNRNDPAVFSKPATLLTHSVFAQRDLSGFDSFEEAYHRLLMDIMVQQLVSTRLILSDSVKRIFVDGGFGGNPVYMHLLAAAFPSLEVFAADITQASAVGAAMAIHEHWNTRPLPADIIELKYFKP
jgi:sugar (pentulose or hexulose) kinase